jgi:protein-tyrosine-phosphatase
MNKKYQILFVCSGNVCRSPMAEAFLRVLLPARLKNNVKILSAGTLGIFGNLASEEAIAVMNEKNIDIRNHISQGVSHELLSESDLILVMAREHLELLQEHYPGVRENIFLLRKFDISPQERREDSVQDPMGFGVEHYRTTRDVIEKEIKRILPRLVQMIDEKINT